MLRRVAAADHHAPLMLADGEALAVAQAMERGGNRRDAAAIGVAAADEDLARRRIEAGARVESRRVRDEAL